MGLATATAGQRVTANLLNRIYGMADSNSHTVTAAAQTDLSSVYTIPANDAAVGTAYLMKCGGTGTWGSTQQTLSFRGFLTGSTGLNAVTIQNTAFSASANFRWGAQLLVIFTTVGAAPTVFSLLSGEVHEIANNLLPGTAANNVVPFGSSSS